MKLILLLLMILTISYWATAKPRSRGNRWSKYKKDFRRRYKNSTLEDCKFEAFEKTIKEIEEHNKEYNEGSVTYKKGVNEFADLSNEEFLEAFTGLQMSGDQEVSLEEDIAPILLQAYPNELPKRIDWRESGLVTRVKNQRNCGACWAFSATAGLEAQFCKQTGELISLSEQNLVDCATKNRGCDGGDMNRAFSYVQNNGGINSEETYKYVASGGSCRYDSSNPVLSLKGYVNLQKGSEQKLKEALAVIGPICVGVDASSWHYYKEGIFSDPESSSVQLNHAALVVGYDSNEFGVKYWIVKNSWGTTWGIDGYMHLAMNANNMCGVATMPSYPVLTDYE